MSDQARSFERLAFAGVCLLLAVCAIASLTWPFGWDQGIFAWGGDVIVRGGVPYRDAWEQKGPLVFYVYAAAQSLLGRELWSIRSFDLAFMLAASILLYSTVRSLWTPLAARWSVALWALWYASGTYWHTAQPDGWIAMLMIVGCGPLVVAQRLRWPSLVAAGLALGSIVLLKYPYAILGSVVLTDIALRDGSLRRRVSALLVVGAASLVPIAAVLLWFATQDALAELVEAVLVYPAQVYVMTATGSRLQRLARYVGEGQPAVALLPLVGMGLLAIWQRSRRHALVLLAWVASGGTVVLVQGRFFDYHWLPVAPPLVILAAVASTELLVADARPRPLLRWGVAAVSLAVFAHIGVGKPLLESVRWLAYVTGLTEPRAYQRGFGPFERDSDLAQYIRSNSNDSDTVVVWGWESGLLFMAARESPSRFGFAMPLMIGEGSTIRERYRAEFLADFDRAPPRFIVESPLPTALLGGQYGLDDFPELARRVRTEYRPVRSFETLVLHRRLEVAAQHSPEGNATAE